MQKQSFKERERERREQEILRAAAQLIRERGYNNVSMDDIAVEVGVSKPTLYQHFKSKDDMIASTMVQSMQSMRALIDELAVESPLAKLTEMLRHMLESYDNPDRFLSVLAETEIIHMLNHHPDVVASRDKIGEEVYALIEAGKARGEIAADIPTPVILGTMFSTMKVVDTRGQTTMEHWHLNAEVMIEGIIKMFVRGIRAEQP